MTVARRNFHFILFFRADSADCIHHGSDNVGSIVEKQTTNINFICIYGKVVASKFLNNFSNKTFSPNSLLRSTAREI